MVNRILAAFAAILLGGSAHATLLTVSFSGNGDFGQGVTAFTGNFTYDTNGAFIGSSSGTGFTTARYDALISLSLTAGSTSFVYDGLGVAPTNMAVGIQDGSTEQSPDAFQAFAVNQSGIAVAVLFAAPNTFWNSAALPASLSPQDFSLIKLVQYYDPSTGVNQTAQFSTFTVTSSDVPESESWAMMVCGFGLVGVASRAVRRQVHFA